MVTKQTLGTGAAVTGVAALLIVGMSFLGTGGQSSPAVPKTTPTPISTQYATPADNPLAPVPSATPSSAATDTTVSTPAPVAPAPAAQQAAPQQIAAPAPAPVVVAPAPAPAPAPAIPPVRCPAGSSANSNDGVNDTSCYPDICLSPGMIIPDPAHPECDAPFKP